MRRLGSWLLDIVVLVAMAWVIARMNARERAALKAHLERYPGSGNWS